MTKAGFMEVLANHGFKPINEDGCIMIITPNKEDHAKMEAIAKKCGYAGCGSYGWRKPKGVQSENNDSVKKVITEPIYSEEEKDRLMKKAIESDVYQLTFVEYIQNEEWYDDTKKVLKEYKKFLDDPEHYGVVY